MSSSQVIEGSSYGEKLEEHESKTDSEEPKPKHWAHKSPSSSLHDDEPCRSEISTGDITVLIDNTNSKDSLENDCDIGNHGLEGISVKLFSPEEMHHAAAQSCNAIDSCKEESKEHRDNHSSTDDESGSRQEYIDLSQYHQSSQNMGLTHDQYLLRKDILLPQSQRNNLYHSNSSDVRDKNILLFDNLNHSFDKCLPTTEGDIPNFSSTELTEITKVCFSAMCVVFSSYNPSKAKFSEGALFEESSVKNDDGTYLSKGTKSTIVLHETLLEKDSSKIGSDIFMRHQRRLAGHFESDIFGADNIARSQASRSANGVISLNYDAVSSHASTVEESYHASSPIDAVDSVQRPMVPLAVVYMLWSKLISVRFYENVTCDRGEKQNDSKERFSKKSMKLILDYVRGNLVEMSLLESCHQRISEGDNTRDDIASVTECLRINHDIHLLYGLHIAQDSDMFPFFLRGYQDEHVSQRPKSPYHIFDDDTWNPEHALNFILASSCLSRVQSYTNKKDNELKIHQRLKYEYSVEMLPWHLMRSLQYNIVAGLLVDPSFVKARLAILDFTDAAAMQVADLEELYERVTALMAANPSLHIEIDLHQTITQCYGLLGSLIRSKDESRMYYDERDDGSKLKSNIDAKVDVQNVLSVAKALEALGDSLFRYNLQSESMRYYYRAMVRYEHINAIESKKSPSVAFNEAQFSLGGVISRIAAVYACENTYGDAMLCYEKALCLYSTCQSKRNMYCIAKTLASMGELHVQKKELDPALSCFNEALTIWKSMDDSSDEIANLLLLMGNVRREMENLDEALELFSEALYNKVLVYGKFHPEVAFIHHRIGLAYCDRPDFEKALSHFNSALKIRKSAVEIVRSHLPSDDKSGRIHSRELEVCETLECIGKIHEIINDLDVAFNYFNQSSEYHRSHLLDFVSTNESAFTMNDVLGILIAEPDSSAFVEDIYRHFMIALNSGLKICPLGGIFRNDIDEEVEGQMAELLFDMGMVRGAQYLYRASEESIDDDQIQVKDYSKQRYKATVHLEDSVCLREKRIERLQNDENAGDENAIDYERIAMALTLYELGKMFSWFVMRTDIEEQYTEKLPLILSSRSNALRDCRSAIKYFEEARGILQDCISITVGLDGHEEDDIFISRLKLAPSIYEEMLQIMAILYRKIGKYDKSVECYNEVSILLTRMEIDNDTNSCSEDSVIMSQKEKVAYSSQSIGDILFDTGEFSRALESYEEALQLRRAIEGDSLIIADTLSRKGAVLLKLKRWDDAALTFDEALRIRVDRLPQDHRDIAETFHLIGKSYEGHEKLEQALDYYKKAQRHMSGRLVDKDTAAAEVFFDLGKVVLLQVEASELFKRMEPSEDDVSLALTCLALSRDIYRRNFGDEALEVGNALNLLGAIYHKYGEHHEAITSYKSALKIYRGAPLDQTAKICKALLCLGKSLTHAVTEGNEKEVFDCLNLALELYEENESSRNEDYATLIFLIGEAYLKFGECAYEHV